MILVNANPINQPLEFTQGDTITLTLQAQDDYGNPQNLTGATLQTQIQGPNGVGPVTFGNSQHTISNQTTNLGQFTLSLAQADTTNCGEGAAKDIVTQAIISGSPTFYRGYAILTVYANAPRQ